MVVGTIISVLTLAGVVWWAVKQEAPRWPSQPGEFLLLGLAVAAYAGNTLGRGWRWHAVLRWTQVQHRPADAYGLTTVMYMGNTVLPVRGGEALRILLMGERSSARRREVLGTVLTERTLDAATLVILFSLLTWTDVAGAPAGRTPAVVATAVLGIVVAAGLVYLRLRIAGHFERFASRIRPVARSARLLLGRRGLELAVATIAVWAGEAVVFWLVAQSLDLPVGLVEATFIVVVASFFGLIPAGPGYVGTFDAAVVFGLNALGIAGGAAVGCLLLYRFIVFVPVTLAGLALVMTRYGGLSALRRGSVSGDR